MTTTAPSPAVAARLLADLVDLLLPGGGDWPSGATIGVQSTLAIHLVEERGEADLTRLAQAILQAGGPFAGQPEERRIAIVRRCSGRPRHEGAIVLFVRRGQRPRCRLAHRDHLVRANAALARRTGVPADNVQKLEARAA